MQKRWLAVLACLIGAASSARLSAQVQNHVLPFFSSNLCFAAGCR